jgi:hypothetical protein
MNLLCFLLDHQWRRWTSGIDPLDLCLRCKRVRHHWQTAASR